ncbi:MAG: amino acid ABC transporter substrate-binding protein [Leptospiraceae bacterium]|nr:amino acid ABC transporter substrate-binding protein [Leptospiraceae bacterium]
MKIQKNILISIFVLLFFWQSIGFAKETNRLIPEKSGLEEILETKQLMISVSEDNEPYYIYDPKPGYPGFEVEIARAYADYLGVKLTKITPLTTFKHHAEALEKGKVHISMGNSSNLERGKLVSFSLPYTFTSTGGLVNKLAIPPEPEGEVVSNNPYKSILDLQFQPGIRMAVKSDTYNYTFIREQFGGKFQIYTYLKDSLALQALLKNTVNCYIADNLYLEGLLQKYPSLKNDYKPLLSSVVEKQISIAVRKYDILLLTDLNFFIREMKRSGQIEKLKQKYFNNNKWVTGK